MSDAPATKRHPAARMLATMASQRAEGGTRSTLGALESAAVAAAPSAHAAATKMMVMVVMSSGALCRLLAVPVTCAAASARFWLLEPAWLGLPPSCQDLADFRASLAVWQ